jgi:hypothetical protein
MNFYFYVKTGEVTELVPFPGFKSVISRHKPGKVSSILMHSRQKQKTLMECSMRVFTAV